MVIGLIHVSNKNNITNNSFDNMVADMLNSIQSNGEGLSKSNMALKKCYDYCSTREFYKKNEARTREFAKNMSAYELYVHLLDRIVNSPLKFYADGVVIMIVPILFEKCAD